MQSDLRTNQGGGNGDLRGGVFERISQALPDILFVIDLIENRIVYANSRVEGVLRYTVEQFCATPLASDEGVVHPDDRLLIARWLSEFQLVSDGEVREGAYRLRDAGGLYRRLRVRGSVFDRSGDGGVRRVVCNAEEITDQRGDAGAGAAGAITARIPGDDALKQAEHGMREREAQLQTAMDSLAASEDRFRLMANSIPQLAWMARPDGWLFWYNQRWYDYTGADFEKMQGWGWERVHDPALLPGIAQRWQAAQEAGEPWEDIFPLRRHDGAMRRHLSRAQPFRNESGEIILWFGTNTDIEAQLQSEEALAQTRQRLELSIDAAELGTFYCPAPFGRIEWNAKCKEHFWLAPEAEIDFDLFYGILHPDDREATRLAVEKCISEHLPYDVEYRTVAPDGRFRWIRAKGRAYYDAAGEPLRFDGVTVEISEQKRAEEERLQLLEAERLSRAEAERASRLKDEFLATLSHELRTPLNAILGWSHLLHRKGVDEAEALEGIAVIERNARLQVRLVEDLLDMSRIISGKLQMEAQSVGLAEVIGDAIEAVRPSADTKGIRIEKTLDDGTEPVRGDPARLQQVVCNLLSNAVKFTPRGGRVQVVLTRANALAQIVVTDDGEGIAPAFLPFVFDRFRQADGATTRRHGGLGIGLAIVKSIVEAHGGKVIAQSAGPGKGASFNVELPLLIAGDDRLRGRGMTGNLMGVGGPDPICESAVLEGLTVLVVDDDADAKDLLRRLLEDCHAKVRLAASADEALAVLQCSRADVLLSDIGMPGEDGYSLISKVRNLPVDQGGNIPAAAITALVRSEDRRKALLAGFQSHISKPVEASELVAVVANLAGRIPKERQSYQVP